MASRAKSRQKGRAVGRAVRRDRKYASLVASGRGHLYALHKLIGRDARRELDLDPLGPAHTMCWIPQTSGEW